MQFSVVIPTYNRRTLICDAIESVLAQEHQGDYEILVGDDGSTDGTPDLVEEKFGERVRVFRQANAGPGAARNLACAHAKGKYLAFLDSDDMFVPWTLSTYAAILEKQNNPSIIIGCAVDVREPSQVRELSPAPLEYEFYENLYLSNMAVKLIATDRLTVRRDAFEQLGGFTTQVFNGEDIDFLARAGVAPGYVVIRAPTTFLRRYHEGQITQNVELAYEGRMFLIDRELGGTYPGGVEYARHRQELIAFWARAASMQMLRYGRQVWGWRFYKRAFGWNVRGGRWLYLAGYPLIWLRGLLFGKHHRP